MCSGASLPHGVAGSLPAGTDRAPKSSFGASPPPLQAYPNALILLHFGLLPLRLSQEWLWVTRSPSNRSQNKQPMKCVSDSHLLFSNTL